MWLARLLHPVSPLEFYDNYFERKPLHIPHQVNRLFAEVLSLDLVRQLLRDGHLTHPTLQLAHSGAYIAPDEYVVDVDYGSGVISGVLDATAVVQKFNNGATIVLNAFNRHNSLLRELCGSLSREFVCDVNANAYITPPASAGFASHYDTHDVFVLQIAGAKRWSIHQPTFRLPLPGQADRLPADLGDPLLQITLHAGSVLYLPRGFIHAAETTHETSIHISIGVTPFTWYDLLREALRRCKNDELFRHAIRTRATAAQDSAVTYSSLLSLVAEVAPYAAIEREVTAELPKRIAFPDAGDLEFGA